jgi:PadR family transcriptional regulator PadR
MPGGRRKGGGRRRQRVMSFLQPCLLLMLMHGEAHGYSLIDELSEFGFNPDRLDPSLIYRALREMEDGGWVTSHWDDDSQGPRRRVYQITADGKDYLKLWIEDLRRTQQEIEALLSAYEQFEVETG